MPPRKSYTAAFKLEFVKYAKENGNRAAALNYTINESMVRSWRKQEDPLRLRNLSVPTGVTRQGGLP